MRKMISALVVVCCLLVGGTSFAQEKHESKKVVDALPIRPINPDPPPVQPPAFTFDLPKEVKDFLTKIEKLPEKADNAIWWLAAAAITTVVLNVGTGVALIYVFSEKQKSP